MTVSRQAMTDIAALSSAIRGLVVRLETTRDTTVIVGDGPDASLCSHAFHAMVAHWPDLPGHNPLVSRVTLDGVDLRGGVIEDGDLRWFCTRLSAQRTVVCLRESEVTEAAIAQVRYDVALRRSVVRLAPRQGATGVFGDAALSAFAACLTAELLDDGDDSDSV